MDENINEFDRESLIPALDRLKDILKEAGIEYKKGAEDAAGCRVLPEASMTSAEGGSGYEASCLARLEKTASLLDEEEELHSGVLRGAVPCIQLQYEELVITLCYEGCDEDKEILLLHLRSDIPYKGEREAAESFCEDYDRKDSFSRAYTGLRPFPVSGSEDEMADCITFHACVPEKEDMQGAEWLSFVTGLFAAEIENAAG